MVLGSELTVNKAVLREHGAMYTIFSCNCLFPVSQLLKDLGSTAPAGSTHPRLPSAPMRTMDVWHGAEDCQPHRHAGRRLQHHLGPVSGVPCSSPHSLLVGQREREISRLELQRTDFFLKWVLREDMEEMGIEGRMMVSHRISQAG